MTSTPLPILEFVLKNYKNFNSRATRDALLAYWEHVHGGGRMFWAMAGAMSSAQLGITLAPAIRAGLVHGLPVGLSFFGLDWSEARLLRLAFAFERETRARRPPEYRATIG